MTIKEINKEIRWRKAENMEIIKQEKLGIKSQRNLNFWMENQIRINYLKAVKKKRIYIDEVWLDTNIERLIQFCDRDNTSRDEKKIRKIVAQFNNKMINAFELKKKANKINFYLFNQLYTGFVYTIKCN